MDNKKKIEIPFGAFDSELIRQEINIPNGFKAVINGNKIILTRAESEDERIRKEIIAWLKNSEGQTLPIDRYNAALAWLEKQGEEQPIIRWHSINEEPEEMKELFCEWESDDATWHDVAFYDKESHTFRHAKMPINVTKWVYVDELLEEQAEVVSDKDDIEAEEEGIREAFNKIEDEKQCKQKPQRMISAEAKEAMYKKPSDKIEPKFKVGDSIKTANEEPLTITEITDNGYWSEDLFICNFDDAAKWELVEQKPAWSIKEKLMLNDIIETTERSNIFKENYQRELIDWLKSLKTKVQPKQEWSEEDEKMLKSIISTCELAGQDRDSSPAARHLVEIQTNWLKSLRPQNRWKPSDEQMEVLLSEVTGWKKGCPKQIVLESLYNDLKNLK